MRLCHSVKDLLEIWDARDSFAMLLLDDGTGSHEHEEYGRIHTKRRTRNWPLSFVGVMCGLVSPLRSLSNGTEVEFQQKERFSTNTMKQQNFSRLATDKNLHLMFN